MQLTPRTLTLALGACLGGGLVLGTAAAVSPAVGASSASPGPTASTTNYSPAELGDAEVSFPSPTTSASPRSAAPSQLPSRTDGHSASPVTSTEKSTIEVPVPTPTVDATATPLPTSAARAPRPTAVPAQTPSPKPRPARTTPDPGNPVSSSRPHVQQGAVTRSTPEPLDGWRAPHLGVGVTNIGAPRLSSGWRANVTVMCTPSASCSASGSSLTIMPDASQVWVTWSAPASDKWRSWAATRSYGVPQAG